MSDFEFDPTFNRREFFKIAGAGVLTPTGVGAASVQENVTGGDALWSFETGRAVLSSPTVIDGNVFIGSNDGNVYALDAENGTQQWAFETGGSVYSSPTVVGNTVFVGSFDSYVYALDAGDGSQQWRFETTADRVWSSPTVADSTVFVGGDDGNMYALDAENGDQQWAFDTGSRIKPSPTVVGGTVFIGNDNPAVYALNAEDGNEKWTFEPGGFLMTSSPTVVDGTVFIGGQESMYALHAEDGDKQWAFGPGAVESSPTVVDDTVFVGGFDNNHVYALDVENGDQQWGTEMPGPVRRTSPTVADGTVFVGCLDDNVYALDAENGTQQWAFETGSLIVSSPTVVDGTVFIGSHDGNVYAIDGGVEGSSIGSRVLLRTLGHHDKNRQQSELVVDVSGEEGDFTEIQPAVDEAEPGTVIRVLEGTYEEAVLIDKTVTITTDEDAVVTAGGDEVAFELDTGEAPDAAPTISGFTISGFTGRGIDFSGAQEDWTVENVRFEDVDEPIVATDTAGNWTVRNVETPGTDVAIDAAGASGDWTVEDSAIGTGTIPAVGIDAAGTSGDWFVHRTDITASDLGVDATESTGDWRIQGPADISAVDVPPGRNEGVRANGSTGAWRIHRINFETDGDAVVAVGAEQPGNARRNWYGTTGADEPAPPSCRGNVLCGNPLGEPASEDATGIEVGVVDASGEESTILQDATVYLYKKQELDNPEGFSTTVSDIQSNEIERLFSDRFAELAVREVSTGPEGLVRYTGLDPSAEYYVLVEPPAINPGNVSAFAASPQDGDVTFESIRLTDTTILDYLTNSIELPIPSLSHYPLLDIMDSSTDTLLDLKIGRLESAYRRTEALDSSLGDSGTDTSYAIGFADLIGDLATPSPPNAAPTILKLSKGATVTGAVALFADVADEASAAHMIGWTIPRDLERHSTRYEDILHDLDQDWFNAAHDHTLNDFSYRNDVQTIRQSTEGIERIHERIEDIAEQTPAEGFNHNHARNVAHDLAFALQDGFPIYITPYGEVFNIQKGREFRPLLEKAADRLQSRSGFDLFGAATIIVGLVGGFLVISGIGAPVGAAILVGVSTIQFGRSVGKFMLNIGDRQMLATNFAKHHVDTIHDIENLYLLNQTLSDWLVDQFDRPTTGSVDGRIRFTDGFDRPIEPDLPEDDETKTIGKEQAVVEFENTGETELPARLLGYSRYTTDADDIANFGEYYVTDPPADVSPERLQPNNEIATNLEYTFGAPGDDPFRVHTVYAVLTLEGEWVDTAKDWVRVTSGAASAVDELDDDTAGQAAAAYTTAATPDDRPMIEPELDTHRASVSTAIDMELPPDTETTASFTTTADTSEVTVLLLTPSASDIGLVVENADGDRVGAPPGKEPVTEIDDSRYSTMSDGAQATLEAVAEGTYSVRVASSFLGEQSVPVTVLVIETPKRPPILGTIPTRMTFAGRPGTTRRRSLTVTEVGNQQPIEELDFLTEPLVNDAGTQLPDGTIELAGTPTSIQPSERVDVRTTLTVPEEVDLTGEPTRFSGAILVFSDDVGTLTVPVSVLLLDTDLPDATLVEADESITRVRLRETTLPEGAPEPPGEVKAVYDLQIEGTGEVSVALDGPLTAGTDEPFLLTEEGYEPVEFHIGSETGVIRPPVGDQTIVVAPSPLLPYATETGIIDTAGLREAIDDWRAGDIENDLLRDVIDAWQSGDPVK